MQKLKTVETISKHSNNLYTNERIEIIRLRRRVRLLTELCLKCDEGKSCVLGMEISYLHNNHCKLQVGNDFKHCAKCSQTMGDGCPIDQSKLGVAMHEQLAYCTKKRSGDLPFPLIRFDIFFG